MSDIKYKIIPNKFIILLIYLLPIFYGFLIFNKIPLNFGVVGYFILSILISFVLYYYGIWSAGDAKYLLVLSLYLPNVGIIPFIGNIALITLVYLLIYFIYFYLKVLIKPSYAKSLFDNIFIDNRDKIVTFLKNKNSGKIHKSESVYKIIKQILYFLLFFVFIRLARGDIIESVKHIGILKNNISALGSYFVLGTGIISFGLIYFYRWILNKIKNIVSKFFIKKMKLEIGEEKLKIISIIVAVLLLTIVILYDYMTTGNQIFHKLYLIITLYLAIFLSIKILFYSYKLTFQIGEQDYINIKKIKEGDIIDKDYLIKMFGTQVCLGYGEENKDGVFYPDPAKYIKEMDNPIDIETKNIIQDIYDITNKYHKNKATIGFQRLDNIKILKTFSFGAYIFLGFIITCFFGDNISRYLIESGLHIFKSFFIQK